MIEKGYAMNRWREFRDFALRAALRHLGALG